MNDLKPCPHCGNKVDYAYDLELIPYGIHCPHCHMIVKFTRVAKPAANETMGSVMASISAKWNKRTEVTEWH